ncbi:MAG: RDD family protein [Bacteroidetes bacterium]|nr:RDD family protein [Bacteroidota bacterium]
MENLNPAINYQAENLLDDIGVHLVPANSGRRFLNRLIDLTVFIGILALLVYLAPGFAAILVVPFGAGITYALYIGLMETALKGKTIGKYITGTRAVQESGAPINAGNAFGRAFSQIVPFEPFSAFGSPCNPWHDRWTHTTVVDEKQSRGI